MIAQLLASAPRSEVMTAERSSPAHPPESRSAEEELRHFRAALAAGLLRLAVSEESACGNAR
jgi:hypothetical protein